MNLSLHGYKNKKGLQQIQAVVSYCGERVVFMLGVYVEAGSFVKGKIKSGVDKERMNKRLSNVISIIEDEISKGKNAVPPVPYYEFKDIVNKRISGVSLKMPKLSNYWKTQIEGYRSAGQYDTAIHHEQSLNRILGVIDDPYLSQVTPAFLDEIGRKFKKKYSATTINGTFRDLRAVINKAVGIDGLIEVSGFSRFKIPAPGKKLNVALSEAELAKFFSFEAPTKRQQQAKDVFFFCYYCLGMRIKDALTLEWDNIKGTKLDYRTNKTGHHFKFQLPEQALLILARYRGQSKYVFNAVNPYLVEPELGIEVREQTRHINKALKRIMGALGIDKPVSIHVARHTFAYHNRNSLSSFELRDALGHSSVTTTEIYAGSLSDKMDEIMSKVVR